MTTKIRFTLALAAMLLAIMPVIAQTRTESEIKKMCKLGTANSTHIINDTQHIWNLLPQGKEVSLRNPFSKDWQLNETEVALLEMFDDVLINSKLPICYFIMTDGNFGICKLDGTIVIPPVSGLPRRMTAPKNRLFVGDVADYNDYTLYWQTRMGEKKQGSCGSISAILDAQTLQPIIPYGKYDYITMTTRGFSNIYYYVAQELDGQYYWGVVDNDGNEILPCVYRSIKVENKEFVGDDTVDMFSRLSYLKTKMQRFQRRWVITDSEFYNRLGKSLLIIADGIIKLDASLRESGFYDDYSNVQASSSTLLQETTSKSKTKNDYSPQYDISEQMNYNNDKKAYARYDSMLAAYFAGNKSASPSEVKQWQTKMKQLRQKWEAKGKNFPHFANEDR